MLNQKQIKKVQNLIDQGYSNYRIHKDTGHHITIIAKIRENLENSKKNQIPEQAIRDTNTIDTFQDVMRILETHLQKKELSEKDRKKAEGFLEKLRVMLRVEVDERILREQDEIIQQRDTEWEQTIQQNYVHKDVVTSLEGIITDKVVTINGFENEFRNKDAVHEADKRQIFELLETQKRNERQIQTLFNQNIALQNQDQAQKNYIEHRLDVDIRKPQDQLKDEQKKLMTEKVDFEKYAEAQRKNLDAMFQEAERKRKDVEIQENEVAEREEKNRKKEKQLDEKINRMNDDFEEIMKELTNRANTIDMREKNVKKWTEKRINKIIELLEIINKYNEQKKEETKDF